MENEKRTIIVVSFGKRVIMWNNKNLCCFENDYAWTLRKFRFLIRLHINFLQKSQFSWTNNDLISITVTIKIWRLFTEYLHVLNTSIAVSGTSWYSIINIPTESNESKLWEISSYKITSSHLEAFRCKYWVIAALYQHLCTFIIVFRNHDISL